MRYEGVVPEVRVLSSAEAPASLLSDIRRLMVEAFTGGFSDDDWQHALGGHHVVILVDGTVVAHAAVVPRHIDVGDRRFAAGYVEGVAAAPGRQGHGLGSLAMAELTSIVRDRFEFGALSTDRHSFYERQGWERWRGPTFVRSGGAAVRTPDEDDGIMVLRFGPSAAVDLASAISCEARPGDDW
jgi:aminoglycoside 2'-N-acetyltransferase I